MILIGIWNLATVIKPSVAVTDFGALIGLSVANGLLEPMRQAAAMVTRHLEGIVAHWQQGLTTAFLEGLNSLFSAVKRKARGYRSSEYQTAMLYFVAGKLEIPYYAR